jgi:hypothetical protein
MVRHSLYNIIKRTKNTLVNRIINNHAINLSTEKEKERETKSLTFKIKTAAKRRNSALSL